MKTWPAKNIREGWDYNPGTESSQQFPFDPIWFGLSPQMSNVNHPVTRHFNIYGGPTTLKMGFLVQTLFALWIHFVNCTVGRFLQAKYNVKHTQLISGCKLSIFQFAKYNYKAISGIHYALWYALCNVPCEVYSVRAFCSLLGPQFTTPLPPTPPRLG